MLLDLLMDRADRKVEPILSPAEAAEQVAAVSQDLVLAKSALAAEAALGEQGAPDKWSF